MNEKTINANVGNKTLLLVEAALFAALCFVATYSIQIPTPGTGGYIHPGDAFVLLSGLLLGPVWGFGAAAVGSCLADVLGGYFLYAPVTFFVKGIVALVAYLIFTKIKIKKTPVRLVLSGLSSVIIVPIGYLAFELFIYGAAAFASVPANIIQGVSGLVIATLLYPPLKIVMNKVSDF